MKADDLFARHLDLTPLRGRRRGLVCCRFHEDRTGSLSLDLSRELFHCFGCGVQGGVRRFAELVGECVNSVSRHSQPRPRSILEEARAEVLAKARRQSERLEPYKDLFKISDFIRTRLRFTDEARRVATMRGKSEYVWDLLAQAAQLETQALAVEAEIDTMGPLT